MVKFSAYVSDSDDDEQIEDEIPKTNDLAHEQRDIVPPEELSAEEEEEEEEESSSSSDMHEDELRMGGRGDSSYDEGDGDELDDEDDEDEEEQDLSLARRDPTLTARARNAGVDPQRMHVMQTSLFRQPEEAAALKALSKAAPQSKNLRIPMATKRQQLSRKHSRDSEGDTLRIDSRERASFNHDDNAPPLQRPSRKYTRVAIDSSSSIAADAEDGLVDGGLAFGRSFRVGWGPGGHLVHLGALCNPWSPIPNTTSNTSILSFTKIPLLSAPKPDLNSPPAQLSTKLLQHHLSHSPITSDDSGVPFACPSTEALHFSSFASLFPLTDHSFEATMFRLGEALFDHVDLGIRQDVVEPTIRNRISLVARKARVSRWLEDTVLPVVEAELRAPSTSSSRNALALSQTFTLLTANQISRACDVAADAGYIKLATLIAQAGGDIEFKEDLKEQLAIWKEEKADSLIEEGPARRPTRTEEEDVIPGVDVLKGLDWKRVFGAFLWFSETEDATLRDVFESYNAMAFPREPGSKEVARPVPWYMEKPSTSESQSQSQRWRALPMPPSSSTTTSIPNVDAHFSLIQLHSNPSLSLSQSTLLRPRSFGPSPLDFALPWHLYIILSRVLRARDFGDRGESGTKNNNNNADDDDDGGEGGVGGSEPDSEGPEALVEGHSPSADLLASSYAHQLEQMGMIQEATFVLLHLEGSVGRQKAIRDLLTRSADKLDEWMVRGLVGSLKIPMNWVHEAKAIHAMSEAAFYDAFELYLQAGINNQAHDIAVLEIASDCVIRRDLDMLKDIFERFTGPGGEVKGVEAWSLRGKLFLDYVTILTRLPALLDELSGNNAVPDAVQLSEVERLVQGIPKMIGLLPDVLCRSPKVDGGRHAFALGEMTGALVRVRDRAQGVLDGVKGLTTQPPSLHSMQLNLMDDATKLHHLRATSSARFMKSISCIS
ncbi:hypothetical protein AAF712_003222 [Marasmius tenuissimus]|uniref:Nuclear pore complex protein NUP96 C-terminal domain-containing protein n=1 Tax=Marasmius tenuissimus TaxID=585030 RepID=A0ABR3A9A0_9AGAR